MNSSPTLIQVIGAVLFGLAILHTFSTKYFERLAHTQPKHAGIWHLLGEVEVVFGFWALVLMLFMFSISGKQEATAYLDSRNFTEPLFVFAIMVIAATRPILEMAGALVRALAALLPVVPCAGLVDLYYDIWYCVPSRLAFRLAVRLLHDPSRLADFLVLAERVLVDEAICKAFAAQVQEDDELHEVVGWLKRRLPR